LEIFSLKLYRLLVTSSFVTYIADVAENEFSFLLLKDVTSEAQVIFSDYGWCNDVNIGWQTANTRGVSRDSYSGRVIRRTATHNLPRAKQIHIQFATRRSDELALNIERLTRDWGSISSKKYARYLKD
jgi:hypothetical protein